MRHMHKSRAAARGVSLDAYLRELLEREVATPPREEVLARAAARTERSAVPSVAVVRAGREDRSVATTP